MAETEKQEKTEAKPQTEAQNAEFAEATDAGGQTGEENLDILLDINMPVTVNLGKAEVPFRRLLQLTPGSVLELDKTINQPQHCVHSPKDGAQINQELCHALPRLHKANFDRGEVINEEDSW